jgi:hypothetical protein
VACPPEARYENREHLHREAREGSEDKELKIKNSLKKQL